MHRQTCTAAEEGRRQEGAGAETETGWNLNGSAATAPPAASWIHQVRLLMLPHWCFRTDAQGRGFELTQTSVCLGSVSQADRTKLSHRQGGAQGKMVKVYKLVAWNELWDSSPLGIKCKLCWIIRGFPLKPGISSHALLCPLLSFSSRSSFTTSSGSSPVTTERWLPVKPVLIPAPGRYGSVLTGVKDKVVVKFF